MEHSGLSKKRQKPIKLNGAYDQKAFKLLDEIRLDIVNFVENGESLYLYSEHTGNGKTSWSIKLLLRYFDQIWAGNGFRQRGYFISVPAFLNQVKNFSDEKARQKLIKTLSTVDLVVWDDIASTKLSDYDIQQLLVVVDQRIAEGLANIYTGNITSRDKLEIALGDRLASRIWNTSTLVEFKGKDRREEW
jgi:DNA replication protein DnaC